MAVLALGLAGAAVGGALGATVGAAALGASLGWTIFSYIGNMLFAPKQVVEGPRLQNLQIQTSTDGAPMPRVYGTFRLAGNIIWATPVKETKTETQHGGKGGPSVKEIAYSYSANFAVGICEGLIVGIRRVWEDAQLVHSIALGASPSTFAQNFAQSATAVTSAQTSVGFMRVYPGSETQPIDPLIAAFEGAANTPGFLGTAYVVFENYQLGPNSRPIPNMEFEVVATGEFSYPGFNPTAAEDVNLFALDALRIQGYYVDSNIASGSFIYRWRFDATAPEPFIAIPDAIVTLIGEVKSLTFNSDEDELMLFGGATPGIKWARFDLLTGALLDSGSGNINGTALNGIPDSVGTNGEWYFDAKRTYYWSLGAGFGSADVFVLYFDPRRSEVVQAIPVAESGTSINYNKQTLVDPEGDIWIVSATLVVRCAFDPIAYTLPANATQSSAFMWKARGEIWIRRAVNQSTLGFMVFDLATRTFSNSVDIFDGASVNYLHGAENSAGNCWFVVHTGGGPTYPINAELRTVDGTIVKAFTAGATQTGAILGTAYVPGVVVLVKGSQAGCFYEDALEPFTADLGDVAEDICARRELTAVDVSQLTGKTVRGYKIDRPMSGRAEFEPLSAVYGVDGVNSDGVLKFTVRGGPSVLTLDEDEMGAHAEGETAPYPWSVTRRLETELPASMTIAYLNPATDHEPATATSNREETVEAVHHVLHEFPVVLTSEEAQRVVENLHRQMYIEREQFEFALGIGHIELDATDVVTLPEGSRVRLTRALAEASGVIRCEAVGDDLGALISYAVGTTDEPGETIDVPFGGMSTLVVLDIPLLLDVDNPDGIYTAACGETPDWPGAMGYWSADGGSTWSGLTPMDTPAKIGRIVAGSMYFARHGGFDHVSRITIRFVDAELAPATASSVDAFLEGENLIAMGDGDRWELVQAYDAEDNGDGTFDLFNFLRGRKGTEWAISAHTVGAAIVFLEMPEIVRAPIPRTLVGADIEVAAVTFGGSIANERIRTEAYGGIAMIPYSPSYIGGAKLASGDIQTFWQRRARVNGQWRPSVDVPLDEDAELYDVEFWEPGGTTLGRSIADHTATSYTYTAAMQTTDFGGSQNYVLMKTRLRSAAVGGGYWGESHVGSLPAASTYDVALTESPLILDESRFVVTRSGALQKYAPLTRTFNFGRWYWEFLVMGTVTSDVLLGLTSKSPPTGGVSSNQNRLYGGGGTLVSDGDGQNGIAAPSALTGTVNVVRLAWDAKIGRLWIGKNESWGGTADPDRQTNWHFSHTPSTLWRPTVATFTIGSTFSVVLLTAGRTLYAPPAGFYGIDAP